MESSVPLKREDDEDNRSSIQKDQKELVEIIEEVSIPIDTPPAPDSRSKKLHTSSSKDNTSVKNFISKLSFKSRTPPMETEKYMESEQREKFIASRTLSFKNLFKPAVRRTFSLPVRNDALLSENSLQETAIEDSETSTASNIKGIQKNISRSLSVPLNKKSKSIKRMASSGNGFRVVPSAPKAADTSASSPYSTSSSDNVIKGEGEDIPEEEAVCRICMIELNEGGDTMKLECDCKGELSLTHQECAVKWFSLKGNKNCEVCKQEVRNLSVTLLRVELVPASNAGQTSHQANLQPLRLLLDKPVLVITSMLLYFCFLEQLLVYDIGYAALPVSLPLSCFLALLASLAASTIPCSKYDGDEKYIWVYASIEFVLVVFFAHLFYREEWLLLLLLEISLETYGVSWVVCSIFKTIYRRGLYEGKTNWVQMPQPGLEERINW